MAWEERSLWGNYKVNHSSRDIGRAIISSIYRIVITCSRNGAVWRQMRQHLCSMEFDRQKCHLRV
ncbi:MAG: hypothetical protein J7F05_20885 [Trichodesmium erythraeum GBRTRLIN201]|nr:hypothetical protein [Trichodesmium erythraeum GBRTRLIN201]